MIMVGLWEVTGSRGQIPPEEHQCPPKKPETSTPPLLGNKETLATCNQEEGPPPNLTMLADLRLPVLELGEILSCC